MSVLASCSSRPKSFLLKALRNGWTVASILWVLGSPCSAAPADAYLPVEPIKPLPVVKDLDPRKLTLGAALFADPRLSGNGSVSCLNCHDVKSNGADGAVRSLGTNQKPLRRNTPTVFNSSVNFRQFWDGHAASHEALVTEVVQNPLVMNSNWPALTARLSSDADLVRRFREIYPDGLQQNSIIDALSQYMRSLTTPDARIDHYLKGNEKALSEEELKGYRMFKEYGCVACHQGANIGGNMYQAFGVIGKRGEYFLRRDQDNLDYGRYAVTRNEKDKFVWRVPSLRNVAVTAPYFHDGSVSTLEEAVRLMFEYQLGRKPSTQDIDLIVKFLNTLTGEYQGHPLRSAGAR